MPDNEPGDRPGPPGLDLTRLRPYLEARGLTSGPLRAQVYQGGRSNLTYLVDDGTRRYVVRRPPLGHVLATAHDMAREHRVVTALRGTGVPVPGTYALCRDEEVIGAPFYVMEWVPGSVIAPASPHFRGDAPVLGPDAPERAIAPVLAGVLARLHSLDHAALGLGDFGRPEGYLERQVRRWKRQLDSSRSRELPGIDDLHARLAARLPEPGRAAIVHGDFKLANTIVGDDGRIMAIVDWEMSTLGDPLTDLALFLLYSRSEGYGEGLEERYADASGRDPERLNRSLSWYLAFACFKLAIISEGIHYRYGMGLTVGEGFEQIGAQVGPLVERGRAALEGQ